MKKHFHEEVICPDLHSQSQWQSTIQTSGSWHWNIPCLCVLSISHILSGSLSLSHHLSPKGRILEESLIIFTAHSIIPAKRLIHDLPQWRPTPPSQEEGEAKQERKSAPVQQNILYILRDNFYDFEFSCGMRSVVFFFFVKEEENKQWHLYDWGFTGFFTPVTQENTVFTAQNALSSAIILTVCQGKSSPKSLNLSKNEVIWS